MAFATDALQSSADRYAICNAALIDPSPRRNIRPGPAGNISAVVRIALDDERVTHGAARRTPQLIQRKIQRDQWLRNYLATSVYRFHRQHAETQTRTS